MNVYAESNEIEEYMNLFRKYLGFNHAKQPMIFYTIILAAYTNAGHYLHGKEVYGSLINDNGKQWILSHHEIQTNLINFYVKCGMIHECKNIFEFNHLFIRN